MAGALECSRAVIRIKAFARVAASAGVSKKPRTDTTLHFDMKLPDSAAPSKSGTGKAKFHATQGEMRSLAGDAIFSETLRPPRHVGVDAYVLARTTTRQAAERADS